MTLLILALFLTKFIKTYDSSTRRPDNCLAGVAGEINLLLNFQVDVSHSSIIQYDQSCDCGVPNDDIDTRIVGGRIIDAHRFPWMVAILADKFLCGGVLISDRYVLTAGHCLDNLKSIVPDVFLGKHNLDNTEEGVIIPGIDWKIHPGFFSESVRDVNDIGLIKLEQSVTYTRNIRPVCLPKQGGNYTNQKVQLAGWGSEKEKGDMSDYLKETTVEVISSEECANTKDGPYITENMLCTYTDGTDACQGDSGGPLLLEREQNKYETIGVVSWGFGCAEKGSPGVHTKVISYLDWILLETQDSIYCKNE